jgi:hypothetical protein
MATRGTISFSNKFGKLGFVYIHHDMYPSGFSEYLKELKRKNVVGRNLMTQLLRGIEGAEVTTSHEIHGDTEFRYDIEEEEISIIQRFWEYDEETDEETNYFSKIATMPLEEFLKKY